MTDEEFLEVFNLLELNYSREIPDEIIKLWYEKFKEVKKDDFKEAVVDYIEREKTFPTISEINENVEFNTRRRF